MSDSSGVRARLDERLRTALRARDRATAATIRTTFGAIANAEAVPVDPAMRPSTTGAGPIAGAAIGVGATEADRRELHEADVIAIVEAEIVDLLTHAAQLDEHGARERADDLRTAAATLRAVLDAEPGTGDV